MSEDTSGGLRADASGRAGRIVFAAFVVLGLAALFLAAWTLRNLLLLLFLTVLFAVLLRSSADRVGEWSGLGPTAAVLGVVLLLIGLVALAVVGIVPTLMTQGSELVQRFPQLVDAVEKRISDTPFLSDAWDQVKEQFNLPSPASALSQVGPILGFLSSSIGNVVFVAFSTIFLALSPGTYVEGIRRLVPPDHRGFTIRLLDELGGTLRAWFGGQLAMMTMVGTLAALGLWMLGVPYWLALGVFAGLLDFIPFIGPILGAAPAIIVAFSVSPATALWALALFVVVQQLESNVMGPLVQQSAVSIPPAALLVFLFGMGQVFGLPGLLVATPFLAVLLVVVRRIYVERILEGTDRAGQGG